MSNGLSWGGGCPMPLLFTPLSAESMFLKEMSLAGTRLGNTRHVTGAIVRVVRTRVSEAVR